MLFEIKDLVVDVDVIYKPKNKRTYLRLKDKKVIITSFKKYKENEVLKILNDYYVPIKKMLNTNEVLKNSITIFNKTYNVVINEADIDTIYIKDDNFIILTTTYNNEVIKKRVNEYLANLLKRYVETKIYDILNDFSDILTTMPNIEYKYLKSAFGKCYTTRNKIILSTICTKYDFIYIDYVIYHEFAHFKYSNHQEEFYNYLEIKFKNCKKVSKNMKKIKYNDTF